MKICPKCGMKAEDDVVFCSKCGTKYKDQKTVNIQIIVLVGLICVLLAGCIVVGALLYLELK